MTAYGRSLNPRYRRMVERDAPDVLTKEDAPCCVARRDAHGRLPVGFCSPTCVRRPAPKETDRA